MTQYPPPPSPQVPMGYGYSNAPRRSNGAAIASLVLGILGCVPFITGLFAVILGFIGIRKSSRDPSVGGMGMAVAGLILGILSIIGWAGFGGLFGYGYLKTQPARNVARQFLQDASSGNTSAAAQSSGLTADQLQTLNAQMASLGTFQSITFISYNFVNLNGRSTTGLVGIAKFSKGPKTCIIDLAKTSGTYKVTSCLFQ